jgi:hypothetical protein
MLLGLANRQIGRYRPRSDANDQRRISLGGRAQAPPFDSSVGRRDAKSARKIVASDD